MKHSERDAGTEQALIERFSRERLPRALALRDKVERGECLDQFDVEFLEEVFKDANENRSIYMRFPEHADIAATAVQLYHDITTRALENEKQQK